MKLSVSLPDEDLESDSRLHHSLQISMTRCDSISVSDSCALGVTGSGGSLAPALERGSGSKWGDDLGSF